MISEMMVSEEAIHIVVEISIFSNVSYPLINS